MNKLTWDIAKKLIINNTEEISSEELIKNPLVSVAVLTYNHHQYIRQALESVISQQVNFTWEIVISDDCSNDGTTEIILEYQKKYPSLIRVLLAKENLGKHTGNGRLNFVRNLRIHQGKYTALLEGDDYWTSPHKLQKQVDFLETHPECVSCHHWHDYAYPSGNGEFKVVSAPTENQGYLPQKIAEVKDIFANRIRIKSRTHMFRNILPELPEWFLKVTFGDVPLTMILGKYGKFGFIDESMAVYRQTGKGISSKGKEKESWFFDHFINWIEIWEYGLLHHNHQYSQEALQTILSFYQNILKHYQFSYEIFEKLLLQATVKSKLNEDLRAQIVSSLHNFYQDYSSQSPHKITQTGRNLIFLISQPRAGSTLTQKILGSHSQIHTISEPWLMLHPLYALRNQGYQTEYQRHLAYEALHNTLNRLPNGTNAYLVGIRKMYSHIYNCLLETTSKEYFLDKTPRYYHVIPELYATFPEAKYIILLRNPLAVLTSILETWIYQESGANWQLFRNHLLDLLKAPISVLESIKKLKDKTYIIHYENLLSKSEEELKKIFNFLGIEFESGIIRYGIEKEVTNSEKWKFGDQSKVYQEMRPDSANVDNWVHKLENSDTWQLVKDYLEFLGEEIIETMGYSYSSLDKIVRENKPKNFKPTIELSHIFPEIEHFKNWKQKSDITSDYQNNVINQLSIKFQTLNLIIFPDWQQEEEELFLTLTEVLKSIASHPQAGETTLIIDISNAENEEEAELLISEVVMNLILHEGIELPETTQIVFIGNLSAQQWEKIGNQVDYRLSIPSEKLPEQLQSLPIYDCHITFPKIDTITNNDDKRPLWSVMIPTYNKFQHLEQTLKSVLDQALSQEEMQIEVVNDHPDKELQDRMEALIKQIGGERIHFYRHTHTDIGQTAIFNVCLNRAKGHWIHLLHDDDYVLPQFYEKLKQGIENNSNVGAIFCRHYLVNQNSENLSISALEQENAGILSNYIDKLALTSSIEAVSVVAKREVFEKIGGYCPQAYSAADWEMWKRVACFYDIWYEPTPLACRRIDDNTWTSRLIKTGENILYGRKAIEVTHTYLPSHKKYLTNLALENYALAGINLADRNFASQDNNAGLKLIIESLKCCGNDNVIDYCLRVLRKHKQTDLIDKLLTTESQYKNDIEYQSNLDTLIQKYRVISSIFPRIVIDGVFFQLFNTGIARVWRSLLEQWANTEFANHILVLDRNNTAPKIDGIRYRLTSTYKVDYLDADRQILQEICDEEEADLFISTYYTIPVSTPSVLMIHDMIPELFKFDLNHPHWRGKTEAIKYASHYLCVSQNSAKDLQQIYPQISDTQVTIAYNGISKCFSQASKQEINDFKYKYGIDKPYFLLGSLGSYKNQILFLQAFSQLINKESFDIVSTGAGSQLPFEWRQYTSGCTFHSLYLTDEELRLAYAGAVALIYPSKYEGFGMPIAEAMACGCPVVTTPNASLPEVGGNAAIYVEDDDIEGMSNALCEIQKPTVRKRLIQKGIRQAEKFSWVSMAQIVKETLLNQIVSSFQLTEINYLLLADWETEEEELTLELANVMFHLANQDLSTIVTLVVDITGISEEEANFFFSSVMMNLMMETELDLEDKLNLTFVNNLNEREWQELLPNITGKITLAQENPNINIPNFEDIISLNSNGNNYVLFPDWQKDEEELVIAISQVLAQIANDAQSESLSLLINTSNAESEEEAGIFCSSIAMNLMLEEGIELPETLGISFVNFNPKQWQSLAGLLKGKIDMIPEFLPNDLPLWK